MSDSPSFLKLAALCGDLRDVIHQTESRILNTEADPFFVKNINFLTKAYLINLCTYLESYLKEVCIEYLECIKNLSKKANLPHNLVVWSQNKDYKEKSMSYKSFEIAITAKDIDEELSGNPFRTAKLFKLLGVNIESEPSFQSNIEIVNGIIAKRNNVIHHNDSARDIALGDVHSYIQIMLSYAKIIDSVIWAKIQPLKTS